MTRSKSLTNYILSHYLIPVPKQQFFNNDDFNKVFDFIKIIGYPVCIKDEYGCEGNDVFPDLRSDSEVCNIIKYLSNKKKSYVIEEYVYGDAYRLYIVGEKIISIHKTSTPYLIGDGISSIKELIVKYNDSFKDKEKDTFDFYRNLQLDYEIENRLKRDGLSLSSILKKDDKYKISAN